MVKHYREKTNSTEDGAIFTPVISFLLSSFMSRFEMMGSINLI
jgi:hypothetical protein